MYVVPETHTALDNESTEFVRVWKTWLECAEELLSGISRRACPHLVNFDIPVEDPCITP